MSGFFVSNNLGTFHSKKAETVKPKVFAATTANANNGDGLSTIASGTTFKDIWASSTKSAQVFSNDTKAYRSNDGERKELPGSANSAKYTFRTYSGEKTDRISLYDDDARRPNGGSYLVGALKIKPNPGVRLTFDLLSFKCSSLLGYLKNGADQKLKDKNPWGTNQEGSVGSTYFNSSWDTGNYRAVRFTLDGDKGDYLEIDMDKGVMSGNNFYVKTGGTWYGTSSAPDDICTDEIRVEVIFRGAAATSKPGCMDSDADNECSTCDTPQNNLCTYTTAKPTLVSVGAVEIKQGEPVVITWSNSNAKLTTVQVLENNSVIHTSVDKNGSYPHTPTTGSKKYKIKTLWAKGSSRLSNEKTVSVVAPTSYIPCTDPNRATDTNTGECAANCNTGYYLGDDGLCTTCDEPNRDSDSNGRCTTCLSGYAEHTDGTCQKVGCMTYADGSSASDDYEYDPDAVVNDSTMCQGKEEDTDPDIVPEDIDCELSDWGDWSDWSEWSEADTSSGTRTRTRSRTIVTPASGAGAVCESLDETETENGELDPDTGEVTITTQTTGSTTTTDETETSSPVVPILIGVAALGALALLMRR